VPSEQTTRKKETCAGPSTPPASYALSTGAFSALHSSPPPGFQGTVQRTTTFAAHTGNWQSSTTQTSRKIRTLPRTLQICSSKSVARTRCSSTRNGGRRTTMPYPCSGRLLNKASGATVGPDCRGASSPLPRIAAGWMHTRDGAVAARPSMLSYNHAQGRVSIMCSPRGTSMRHARDHAARIPERAQRSASTA